MDAVSQIKQTLDIVDIVGGYLQLKKSGKNYKGLCPFHTEKTPSFMVSPELQIYKCFGCGVAGDIFNFIQQIEGVEFISALETLAERAGVKLEKRSYDPQSALKKRLYLINDLAAKFYRHLLTNHKVGKKGLKYLKKDRGLTDKTIADFGLGYAPNTWDILYKFLSKNDVTAEEMLTSGLVVKKRSGGGCIDKFRGRITFPLTGIDGKVVGFTGRDVVGRDPKYLNSPETPVFYKSSFLYGLSMAKIAVKKKGAIFVEGQMDVLSAYQKGVKNVVATSGTSLTTGQLKILSRYTNNLTFCFDADEAGINAIFRAVDLAEKQDFNIKVAAIPETYADLDDLLQKDTPLAKEILKNAVSAYDFFFATALKKHDRKSALGKKAIISDLAPKFSKISNIVLFDHYVKQTVRELELSEEVVREMFSPQKARQKGTKGEMTNVFSAEEKTIIASPAERKSKGSYLLSLLLRTDIDTMNNFVYNLNLDTLNDPRVKGTIESLSKHLKKRKDFDVKVFSDTLEGQLPGFVSEIYLWDLDEGFVDPDRLKDELAKTYENIETGYVKLQMEKLSEDIKLAELSNSEKEIKSLTKKFNELSKKLKKN